MMQPSANDIRLIKRYANRKLYDTQESRYVTLQDIAEFVRVGQHVKIIDNKSKEDLTRVTLAQIIYEEEKAGDDRRTLTSLRTFVQEGRDRLMSSFMEGPMGKLVRRDEEPAAGGAAPDAKPDAKAEAANAATSDDTAAPKGAAGTDAEAPAAERLDRKLMAAPKEALDELQRMADDRMKSIVQSAMGTVNQLQGEVKRLQSRIEELEERLMTVTRRKSDSTAPPPPERPAANNPPSTPDSDPEDSE